MSLEKTAYIQSVIDKNNLSDTNATFGKLVQLLNKMTKNEGDTATVAEINALTNPMPNLIVKMTDNGTLTKGSLAVVADDYVRFTGLVWEEADWINYESSVVSFLVDTTLVKGDSNKVYIVGADAKTATLPSSATVGAGVKYAFINNGADGAYGFTVSPNASDMIMGKFANAGSNIIMTGTDDKDIVNTKASARKGDYLILESDGVNGWFIVGGSGIWTEEDQIAKNALITDNLTLKASDSGAILKIATDAKAFTLPLITAAMVAEGCNYTFINLGADDAVALTISPNASDGIAGTIANAAADSVASGAVGKDLVNTKSGANLGDRVKIVATALTQWTIVEGVGVWASEA